MDPALDSLRLDILQADAYAATPDWTRYGVVDPFARLYLLTRGEVRVDHEGRHYTLRPGDLHLLPARRPLDHICDTRAEMLYVHFTARVLGSLDLWDYLLLRRHWSPSQETDEVRGPRFSVPGRVGSVPPPRKQAEACTTNLRRQRGVPAGRPGPDSAELRGVEAALWRLIEDFECGGVSGELAARGALMELLALLVEEQPPRKDPRTALLLRFGPVFEHIDAHLNEDLTVARLARVAHLERSYFSTLFRRAVGESPARYVRRRRIERAQRLLYLTDRTLESIAAELGFCDAFHLSRTFKRLTGRSPRTFRRERLVP